MKTSVPSVNIQAKDTSRKELKTAVTTAGTELTLQPEDKCQTQPSSDNSLSQPQDHSSPTITVITHTPSQAHLPPTHTITYVH